MFGPARWACKVTAFFAIQRLQGGSWMAPDPLDPNGWDNFKPENWSMVIAPDAITNDHSPFAIVHSRFSSIHETTRKVVEDAQLTWTFRRFLPGDPPPWPGAKLRFGCLVIDLVDKSGATSQTSFGGDLFTGLVRAFIDIGDDGLTEGIEIIDDPNTPPEYVDPDFLGTLPEAPWVIYRDGIHTGIQKSEFTYKPATDIRVVAGGHSMPGVVYPLS